MAAEVHLKMLAAKSGDGDAGLTVSLTARALINVLERMSLANHVQLLVANGQQPSQPMGAHRVFFSETDAEVLTGLIMVSVLKVGSKWIQQVGGVMLGDRNMVDALTLALVCLETGGVSAAANAARNGTPHTSTMTKAKAGRSVYLRTGQLLGQIDPGAEAGALLLA